jgi:hypothetical protein
MRERQRFFDRHADCVESAHKPRFMTPCARKPLMPRFSTPAAGRATAAPEARAEL